MGRKKKEKKKKKDEDRIRIKDLLRKINTRDSRKKKKRKHSHRDLSSSPSSSDSESEYVSKPKAIKKIKKSRKIKSRSPSTSSSNSASSSSSSPSTSTAPGTGSSDSETGCDRPNAVSEAMPQDNLPSVSVPDRYSVIKSKSKSSKKEKNQFHDKIKGVTGNQNSSSLKENWSTKNSVSVSNRSDKPTSEGVLPRNILVNFRSETYPFILSTEQFLDFIIDLESADIMGKPHQIKLNSQVTFKAFINYLSSNKTLLVLLKVEQVSSENRLSPMELSVSLEKNDVDDVELQNDHTDTLTTPSKTMVIPNLKTSSGKDVLKWLNCEDWAPRCLEKLESVKMARERAFRELVGQLEIKRCETCRNQHTINILRTVIHEEVEKRIHSLLTKSDLYLLAKKQKATYHIYGNSLLLLNPMYIQCPLCGSAIALGHLNEIFIKDDKLTQHMISVHFKESNVTMRGKEIDKIFSLIGLVMFTFSRFCFGE